MSAVGERRLSPDDDGRDPYIGIPPPTEDDYTGDDGHYGTVVVLRGAQGRPDLGEAHTNDDRAQRPPTALPSPIDWHALFAREVEDEDWLVEGIWPARRAISIVAQYKAGKSLLLFYLAACLALGIDPWTGRRRTPVTVAYFDMEMTEDDVHERAIDFGLQPEDLDRFRYYLLPDLPPLDTPEGGKAALEVCSRDGIQAAMFDTFSRVLAGPEDLSDTIAAYNRWTAIHLKAEGIATARADHVGHTEKNRARGSSSKGADVDVAWVLSRNGNTSRLDHHGITRIRWVPRQLDVVLIEGPPDRYRRGIDGGVPEGTKACADLLDRLGIPIDHGREKARTALTEAGEKVRNDVLTAAIRHRKDAKTCPGDGCSENPESLSGDSVSETPAEQGGDSRGQVGTGQRVPVPKCPGP